MFLPSLSSFIWALVLVPIGLVPLWLGIHTLLKRTNLPYWIKGHIFARGIIAFTNTVRGHFSLGDIIFMVAADVIASYLALMLIGWLTPPPPPPITISSTLAPAPLTEVVTEAITLEPTSPLETQQETEVASGNSGWNACPGAYLSRLRTGMRSYVSYSPPERNRVRQSPEASSPIVGYLAPGDNMNIIDGPECSNNWVWWKVQSDSGLTGWTSEGDGSSYWLLPGDSGAVATPQSVESNSCGASTGVRFQPVWSRVSHQIGCPISAYQSGQIVEEDFESGKMFWRQPIDTAQAVVLFADGTWHVFQHSPYPGSPEYWCPNASTPAQTPPTPRRGFGMMWCDISAIRQGLGNAINDETSFTGAMQNFDNGFMIQGLNGSTYVFYGSTDGKWDRY